MSEFVTLEDGRRVTLHKDRGFTIGVPTSEPDDIPTHQIREMLIQNVLITVLPDGEDPIDDHPWSWLADLARARGLDVTADDLRGLSYEVVLTDNVTRWLSSA